MLFQTLITTFHWNFFPGFVEKKKKGCLLEQTNCAAALLRNIFEGEKKEGPYESFARTVKCRECSEAGRIILSVIKVMRYLAQNMERRRPLWKKRRKVTKNLMPSETNHLGTFCDGTRGNRDSFFAAIYIFQYIFAKSQSGKVGWQCHWKRNSTCVTPTRFMYQ